MNSQAFVSWWRKLEPSIVVLLFLVTWDFSIPPFLPEALGGAVKAASYGIVALLVIGSWKKVVYAATRDVYLLILVLLVFISFIWSAAPNYSIDESKAYLRTFLFGAYIAARYSPREQMQLFACLFGISAILSAAAALALPSYGVSFINNVDTWNGIFSHKQYLARSMTMGSVIFLLNALDSRKHRWVWLAGFGLAIALILLSTSKSALVLVIISLSLLPFSAIIKQNYKLQVFFYLLALVLAGCLAIFLIDNLEDIVVHKLGKDLEFNGRVPIWTLCLDKIWERPFLGYGYSGFWTSEESDYVFDNTWAGDTGGRSAGSRFHAHNGFIDVLLQLGFLGLSIFVINYITVLARVISGIVLNKTKESLWSLQFLTLMLLYNLSEVQTIVANQPIWSVYVSIALSTALQQERSKRKHYLSKTTNNFVQE